MDRFQGWTATLSNGENVWETPPVPGEKSSWQKLLDRLKEEDLKLTSIRVQRGRVTINGLPAKKCDGYFQAYEKYMAMFSREEIIKQGCGSILGDKIYIVWIDNNGNIWPEIRDLEENRIHTTLRN